VFFLPLVHNGPMLKKSGHLTAFSFKPLQSYELFYNCQVAHSCPVFSKRVLAVRALFSMLLSLIAIKINA